MVKIKNIQKTITPCLWFDNNAEEAAKFYVSIFKSSKIGKIARYGKNGPMPEGTVLTVSFKLAGQEFLALNGGPQFKFSEAISFIVYCKNQAEVDYYWEELSTGGSKIECGWLRDKFGLSWQIVPEVLIKMLTDKNKKRAERVMQAIWQMKKINIEELKQAFAA